MPPKAIIYDVPLTLCEVNALANLAGLILAPEDGLQPIDRDTLQRAVSKMASAPRTTVRTDLLAVAQLFLAGYPGGINPTLDEARAKAQLAVTRATRK